jgi:LysR family transcriptional regulator, glycine cleavage system transcriptional activator
MSVTAGWSVYLEDTMMLRSVRQLPSLDLIRGFVAVGRRMSITLAASDLCVTQSAVSRQVRELERVLGVKLLTRGHRSISLTTAGEALFRVADSGLQRLQDACEQLTRPYRSQPVTITASIGVTALWLLPRLGRLQAGYPNLHVRLAADNRVLDLRDEGIDLAIRYCDQRSAPAGSTRLFGESLVPVAHPALRPQVIDSAVALAQHVLLEFDDPRRPWLQWAARLETHRLSLEQAKGVLRFNHYDQVVQAAIAGHGVALGRMALVKPMLDDGRLAAFAQVPEGPPMDYGYWLVRAAQDQRPDVVRVTDWIQSEAAAELSHAP